MKTLTKKQYFLSKFAHQSKVSFFCVQTNYKIVCPCNQQNKNRNILKKQQNLPYIDIKNYKFLT